VYDVGPVMLDEFVEWLKKVRETEEGNGSSNNTFNS
jgi:hypothetical protein